MNGFLRKFFLISAFASLAGGCLGCQAIAWLTAAFAPPRKYPPKYKLPKDKKLLIFVDDYRRPVNYEPIKEDLARRIAKEFTEHEVVDDIIPHERLEDLIYSTRRFRQMGIPAVARKLGAEMVLYVDIRRFSLKESPQSPLWQGRMEVDVKVVDPKEGKLWPEDRPDGYPVTYADDEPSSKLSEGYGVVLAKLVAAKTARKLAKLFYERTEKAKWFGDKDEGP